MNTSALLQHSLLYGMIMSLLLGFIVTISQLINAEIWLSDYPPSVREQFGEMSEKAKRQKKFCGIVFFIGTIVPIVISIIHLNRSYNLFATDSKLYIFIILTLQIFIIMMTFNLFDLLVLDWLIFVLITPGYIVLPGTENSVGYKGMFFHFKGFLKGTVIALFLGVVLGGISLLVSIVFNFTK